jgi:uncharacterized protein YggE
MSSNRPSLILLWSGLALALLTLVGCAAAPSTAPATSAAIAAPVVSTGSERLAAQAQAVSADSIPAIGVNGEGSVLVVPDLAHVTLGVEVRNASLAAAQAEAATRLDAVLTLLKQMGIDPKDIRTSQFTIQPITRVDEQRRQINDGYLVRNTVRVTFRDIKTLGQHMDQITQAGATTIHGLQFDVADPSTAVNQARERAVADARARADHLARLTGVTLGQPVSITESGGPVAPQPVRNAPVAAAPSGAPPTPIEPGEVEIRLSVQIRYAIQ